MLDVKKNKTKLRNICKLWLIQTISFEQSSSIPFMWIRDTFWLKVNVFKESCMYVVVRGELVGQHNFAGVIQRDYERRIASL